MQTKRQLALELATEAHKGQKRKNGVDYITHPIAVAEIAERIALEQGLTHVMFLDDLYIMSILHDTLEDTGLSESIIREHFSDYVLDGVRVLTKKEGESYYDFIMRIVQHYNYTLDILPAIAKIADLMHNMSDLQPGSLKDKYKLAHHILYTNIIQNNDN